jgi:hypothetical protein
MKPIVRGAAERNRRREVLWLVPPVEWFRLPALATSKRRVGSLQLALRELRP